MRANRVFGVVLGGAALLAAGCASTATTAGAGSAGGAGQSAASAQSIVTGSQSASAAGAMAGSATHTTTSGGASKTSSRASTSAASGASRAAGTAGGPVTPPTSVADDVQKLPDPLYGVSIDGSATAVTYQRAIDPTTASRALRTWVLNPYGPVLKSYDESAYTIHGNIDPTLIVAIATPGYVFNEPKYPDMVDGVLNAAGATDLYSPPATGVHAAGYGLVITCGHVALHSRTICTWMGTTPGSRPRPFFGALVITATIPTDKAEAAAEEVLVALTP